MHRVQRLSYTQVAQAGRDAVLGMAAILVPADVPRLLAALDELACFPDEDVRQSVVIMLAGLTGLLSQRSCADLLLPRVMKLLEDNAYLVRKVSQLSSSPRSIQRSDLLAFACMIRP